MAIAKRPIRENKEKASDKTVDELINRGGSNPKSGINNDEVKKVQLRISQKKLDEIDKVLEKRTVAPSRHTWILEAVYEKLMREQSS